MSFDKVTGKSIKIKSEMFAEDNETKKIIKGLEKRCRHYYGLANASTTRGRKEAQEFANPELREIDGIIDACVKESFADSLNVIGMQGGYVILPEEYEEDSFSGVAYGYYEGTDILISQEQIREEIKTYVKLKLENCLTEDNFQSYNITQKEPLIEVLIKEDSVSISAKLPISVKKDSQSFTIDRVYEFSLPIKLRKIHQIAKEIVQKIIEEPDSIDLTYLTEQEFDIQVVPESDALIFYYITDKLNENEDYTFRFVNRFKEK